MTVVKLRPALAEIKNLLSADKDFLKPVVRAVLQEVLEAEMTPALGEGIGGGIDRDVRTGCIDAQGKGDHRGADRPLVFGLLGVDGGQEARYGAGSVFPPPAAGTISLFGSGCALREGSHRQRDPEPSGANRGRY